MVVPSTAVYHSTGVPGIAVLHLKYMEDGRQLVDFSLSLSLSICLLVQYVQYSTVYSSKVLFLLYHEMSLSFFSILFTVVIYLQ